MAINLESLSPAELKALIANAESQMHSARANHVKEVRSKVDALLKTSGLTLAEVYPTRGGKSAQGLRPPVAPKYRNPNNEAQTWSGRGKRPIWFVEALRKRGVTAESLLIQGAKKVLPTKVVKKAPAKDAKKETATKKAKA
jgi:DNA-binding protein H-NS